MYSEFLFNAENNHIADSVILVFSIKNSTDVLFLTAVLNSEFEIIDFFSFLEITHQRSLTFRVLIIFIFHDL